MAGWRLSGQARPIPGACPAMNDPSRQDSDLSQKDIHGAPRDHAIAFHGQTIIGRRAPSRSSPCAKGATLRALGLTAKARPTKGGRPSHECGDIGSLGNQESKKVDLTKRLDSRSLIQARRLGPPQFMTYLKRRATITNLLRDTRKNASITASGFSWQVRTTSFCCWLSSPNSFLHSSD